MQINFAHNFHIEKEIKFNITHIYSEGHNQSHLNLIYSQTEKISKFWPTIFTHTLLKTFPFFINYLQSLCVAICVMKRKKSLCFSPPHCCKTKQKRKNKTAGFDPIDLLPEIPPTHIK